METPRPNNINILPDPFKLVYIQFTFNWKSITKEIAFVQLTDFRLECARVNVYLADPGEEKTTTFNWNVQITNWIWQNSFWGNSWELFGFWKLPTMSMNSSCLFKEYLEPFLKLPTQICFLQILILKPPILRVCENWLNPNNV